MFWKLNLISYCVRVPAKFHFFFNIKIASPIPIGRGNTTERNKLTTERTLYKNGPFFLVLVVSNIEIWNLYLCLCLWLRLVIFLTYLLIICTVLWSIYSMLNRFESINSLIYYFLPPKKRFSLFIKVGPRDKS